MRLCKQCGKSFHDWRKGMAIDSAERIPVDDLMMAVIRRIIFYYGLCRAMRKAGMGAPSYRTFKSMMGID